MKSFDISTSHLIIMVGIPGSGKSFFAEHFADTFKAPIISYGKLKKSLANSEISLKSENIVINHTIKCMLEEISKTKRTMIFDGMNYSRVSCEELAKIAHKLGYEPLFVWVQTDLETAKKRVALSSHNKNINNTTIEEFDRITKQFNPIDRTRKNVVVISGKHTYASQLKIVLKYLSEPR